MMTLLNLFSLIAWAGNISYPPEVNTDIQWILNEMDKSCKIPAFHHMDIVFVNKFTQPSTLGMCYGLGDIFQIKRIELSSLYWEDMPPQRRRTLLAHEMSHCLLNQTHRDDKYHLMFPVLQPAGISDLSIITQLREMCKIRKK